jgi:protein-S-isoprenylcysteine O-methyltransferase Ste14
MTSSGPSEKGAHVYFPPPLVFLGGLLLGVFVHRVIDPAPVPVDRMISVISGLLIILIGLGLIVSARMHFIRTGQSVIPWKPTPSLIIKGPYRFTRNPMYVGLTLVLIGLGLALNNRWISAFAIPALLIVHVIAVLPEERYLSEKFGESYIAYLRRVRRYL